MDDLKDTGWSLITLISTFNTLNPIANAMQSQHKKQFKTNKFKETLGSFKELFRPGSRAPSPAPSPTNTAPNEGANTSSIVVVAMEAPTALVDPVAPVATPIGEDLSVVLHVRQTSSFSGSHGPVSPVATPTPGLALSMDPQLANFPSISVDTVTGTGE
ncbi:hypothetical protein C0991_007141 [Blastosporella zonata]|nr:hypothetical protein C0991_007141 [Blastosporella zonata]